MDIVDIGPYIDRGEIIDRIDIVDRGEIIDRGDIIDLIDRGDILDRGDIVDIVDRGVTGDVGELGEVIAEQPDVRKRKATDAPAQKAATESEPAPSSSLLAQRRTALLSSAKEAPRPSGQL